jgi:hypothetical protein
MGAMKPKCNMNLGVRSFWGLAMAVLGRNIVGFSPTCRMKEILGLLFLVCVSAVTIQLSVTKQIEWKLTWVLLVLGLAGGFVIARFDSFGRSERGPTEEQIATLKSQLLEELKREGFGAKAAAPANAGEADALAVKLAAQLKTVEELARRIGEHGEKLQSEMAKTEDVARKVAAVDDKAAAWEQRIGQTEATARAAQAEIERFRQREGADDGRATEMTRIVRELALVQGKIAWLQAATKEPGVSLRSKAAQEEIEKEINRLIEVGIPDRAERNLWAQRLVGSLPN